MTEYTSLQLIAYNHLREMIYNRELEYDQVYSETKLAQRLSISRTPVRDALNRLARERYIDILPNRGFRLHVPNGTDIHEVYHIRYMIESYCASYIAANIHTEPAQSIVARMRTALGCQKAMFTDNTLPDLRKFWEADQAFHYALLDYLNLSSFNLQYDSFMHICMPQYLKEEYVEGRIRSTLIEHEAIVDALAAGDSHKVREAVRIHLDTTLELRMPEDERDRLMRIVDPF